VCSETNISNHNQLSTEANRQLFIDGLVDVQQNPPGGEQTFVSWAIVLQERLRTDPVYQDIYDDFFQHRPELVSYRENSADPQIQLAARNSQFYAIELDPNYSADYRESHWHTFFDRLLEHRDHLAGYRTNLLIKNVQTNERKRSSGLRAVINLYDLQGASIVDIGSSLNNNLVELTKTSSTERLDQSDPRFYVPTIVGLPRDMAGVIARERVKRLFGDPVKLGESWGLDKAMMDERSRLWAERSVYVSELDRLAYQTPREALARHKTELARQEALGIRSIQADVLNPKHVDDTLEEIGGPKKIVSIQTTFYMFQPEQRTIGLRHAEKLAEPDGLIVVQDFAMRNRYDPTKLDFRAHLRGSGSKYRLFVREMADRSGVWLDLGTYSSGRAERFEPARDMLDRLGSAAVSASGLRLPS